MGWPTRPASPSAIKWMKAMPGLARSGSAGYRIAPSVLYRKLL